MSAPVRRTKVFVSYASADLDLVVRLVAHLGPLRDDLRLIDLFWDQDLSGGDSWRELIGQHIAEADLIVVGVSASYFASPHCRAELKRALARHAAGAARVVPVSLRAVDRGATELSTLNWLPRGSRSVGELEHTDLAYAEVARELRRLASAPTAAPTVPPCDETEHTSSPWHLLETARSVRRATRSYLHMLEALLVISVLALGIFTYRGRSLASSLREDRSPVANVQLLDLETVRGAPKPIVADPSWPAVLLLHVFDDGGYDDHGAVIRDADGETRWQSSGLRSTNDGFLVGLPARSLRGGRYTIELFGVKQGRHISLGAFDFQLRDRRDEILIPNL